DEQRDCGHREQRDRNHRRHRAVPAVLLADLGGGRRLAGRAQGLRRTAGPDLRPDLVRPRAADRLAAARPPRLSLAGRRLGPQAPPQPLAGSRIRRPQDPGASRGPLAMTSVPTASPAGRLLLLSARTWT